MSESESAQHLSHCPQLFWPAPAPPGTDRVQTASPSTDQRRPTSTGVLAGRLPSQSSNSWSEFSQRRYISKRSATTSANKTCPRRAGRSPGWPATSAVLGWVGWIGCGIPSTSPQGYHTATRGQSYMRPSPVASRAAPGSPRGRAALVGSDTGAVPGLPRVRFPCPPAEPGVPISRHRALRVSFPLVSRWWRFPVSGSTGSGSCCRGSGSGSGSPERWMRR